MNTIAFTPFARQPGSLAAWRRPGGLLAARCGGRCPGALWVPGRSASCLACCAPGCLAAWRRRWLRRHLPGNLSAATRRPGSPAPIARRRLRLAAVCAPCCRTHSRQPGGLAAARWMEFATIERGASLPWRACRRKKLCGGRLFRQLAQIFCAAGVVTVIPSIIT